MTGIWEEKVVTEREGRAAELIKILIILAIIAFIVGCLFCFSSPFSEARFRNLEDPPRAGALKKGQAPKGIGQPAPTFDDLLDAIEWVESRGDANAVGDERPCASGSRAFCASWLARAKLSPKRYVVTERPDKSVYVNEYEAIGAYQLHKIYVDNCNRILRLMGGTGHYTYADRWDRNKSRFITNIVMAHYAMKDWKSKRWDMMGYLETAARTHKNPTLRNHESTKAYWLKIKNRLRGSGVGGSNL